MRTINNNKQSMKLYTEEEIKRGLDNPVSFDMTTDEFISSLSPIELPSDDEIKDASIKYYVNKSACFYFEIGAKWMRDKIKLGNK